MKTVKPIDDKWDKADHPEWVKNVLLVGDEMPLLNHEYIVNNIFYYDGELIAYSLEGFEHLLDYGGGWFKIERFETIKDEYIPNAVVDIAGDTFVCEKFNVTATINFGKTNEDIELDCRLFEHE